MNAGTDPLRLKEEEAMRATTAARVADARSKTFAEVSKLYLAAHEVGWRNAKHRAQWTSTLKEYVDPVVASLPVDDIETEHIASILRPIWQDKPETASRVRGRTEVILDFATVHGWRSGANPARWRGHLDKLFPRRSQIRPVKHHAAMPCQDVGTFMERLRARDAVAARALEFAILTGCRSGEVLGARWSEVDFAGGVWTIPRERMKASREHRVALSTDAVGLLSRMLPAKRTADSLIFPGQQGDAPLSTMAMTMVMRRMNEGSLTVHGFRSTFRDWAGETTVHPREVVEAALAHRLGDKVEQAYARGDLFQRRRALMEDWAAFCRTPSRSSAAGVPASTPTTSP